VRTSGVKRRNWLSTRALLRNLRKRYYRRIKHGIIQFKPPQNQNEYIIKSSMAKSARVAASKERNQRVMIIVKQEEA
jgi:hypothetical protein